MNHTEAKMVVAFVEKSPRQVDHLSAPCRTSVLSEMCFISRTGLGIFVADVCLL